MATGRFDYNESNFSCRNFKDVRKFCSHPDGMNGLPCIPVLNSTSVSPVLFTKSQIYQIFLGGEKMSPPEVRLLMSQ